MSGGVHHVTFGWSSNQFVSFADGGDLIGGAKKVIFRELNEMTTTSKWFHTKLCVQVATNQPFCNLREGTQGLESDRWEKKGFGKPNWGNWFWLNRIGGTSVLEN